MSLVNCLPCFISVTYPLDLTKTRLQIQGEGATQTFVYRGMIRTAYGIGRLLEMFVLFSFISILLNLMFLDMTIKQLYMCRQGCQIRFSLNFDLCLTL